MCFFIKNRYRLTIVSLLFKTLWTVRKLTWTTTHEKNQGHCNSWKIVANGHSGWCFMWTFFDWPTNYSHELHFYLRNGSLFIHLLKLFCSLLCRRVLQKKNFFLFVFKGPQMASFLSNNFLFRMFVSDGKM